MESVTPLTNGQLKPEPAGFTFKCSASKLDKKDGPLSKSGRLLLMRVAVSNCIIRPLHRSLDQHSSVQTTL